MRWPWTKSKKTPPPIPREASGTPVTFSVPRGGAGLSVFGGLDSNSNLNVSTAYRCVKILSETVAGLRFQYMRLKGGVYKEDVNSPLHYLLTVQPQPERSAFDFWSFAVQQMLLEGNAYIYPREVLGEVTDLVLCSSGTVTHDTVNNQYHIHDGYNGVFGTFDESKIIHLYLHSSDGRRGESVLSHAKRTLAIAGAGDDETYDRFSNGGNMRFVLTGNRSPVLGMGEIQDDQLQKLADQTSPQLLNQRVTPIPGPVELKQISLSSSDMQFLESRKFTVREICRFFGVHPSFVFDDTSNNYKSAELANVAFLSMTLDPILKRIENEFTRKLIPRTLCCKRIFKFDRNGIYSLDLQSMAGYIGKTIANGTHTINDWRHVLNQPAVELGDKVYISTNLAELGGDKLSGGFTNSDSYDEKEDDTDTEEDDSAGVL